MLKNKTLTSQSPLSGAGLLSSKSNKFYYLINTINV
jgi:hypothetical protein